MHCSTYRSGLLSVCVEQFVCFTPIIMQIRLYFVYLIAANILLFLFCVLGAGKTETTKLILQFLAVAGGREGRLRGRESSISAANRSNENCSIEQKLLEANPALEALGNASTTRNPNSSRFGKWVEVIFSENCVVMGLSEH